MAAISVEQRAQEIKDRDAMLDDASKLSEDEKKILIEHLEVRDRLMRRRTKRKIITHLKDDLGDFTIETRLMNGKERARFLDANKRLTSGRTIPEEYAKAVEDIQQLASEICLTPGLGPEYWNRDDIEDGEALTIVLNTFNLAAQAVLEGVESFRQK